MATTGIYFGGRTIKIPGAYAVGDASDLIEVNVSALNVVMLIGSSQGGKPNTPLFFNSANQAKALSMLRGGPLYMAAQAAWGASNTEGVNAADVIICLRVDPATQAVNSFIDEQTTPALAFDVLARDWGKHGNGNQVQILAGANNAALRRISIKKIEDSVNQVSPDLGEVLTIAYTGNGTASVQVHAVAGVPTLDVAVTGATDGTAGFSIALDSAAVDTLQKLAAFISGQTGYNVKLLGGSTIPSVQLDPMATPAVLASAGVKLLAVNGACVDWINRYSVSCIATFRGNAAHVAIAGPVFLAGGADGVPSLTNWQSGMRKLETEPGYFLVPCTGDPLVHAAGLDHVIRMSDVKVKRRRVMYAGHEVGDVVFSPDGTVNYANLADRVFALNSARVVFATPGIQEQVNGTVQTFGSWLLAAKLAGLKAGNKPQESLTFKYVRTLGLEGDFDTATQEQIIDTAATQVVKVPNKGFRVVLGQCAQLRTTNVIESEPSVLHCADTLLTNLETFLEEKYTGVPAAGNIQLILASIKKDCENIGKQAEALGMIVSGYVNGQLKPALTVNRVSFANRTYAIDLSAALSEPGNYITVMAHWQAVEGAV